MSLARGAAAEDWRWLDRSGKGKIEAWKGKRYGFIDCCLHAVLILHLTMYPPVLCTVMEDEENAKS